MATRRVKISFTTFEAMDQFLSRNFEDFVVKNMETFRSIEIRKDNDGGVVIKPNYTGKVKEVKDYSHHDFWEDMPEFKYQPSRFVKWIDLYFEDFTTQEISKFLDQSITDQTKNVEYPKRTETLGIRNLRMYSTRGNPKYPVYIVSKGRSHCCVTADVFIKMGMQFKIVVEEQEYHEYAKVYGYETLLILDQEYKKQYNTFIKDEDPKNKVTGSGPARNFAWDHSISIGADKHWVVDDNIFFFTYYLDTTKRVQAVDGSIFAHAEDFIDRFTNVAVSGFQYYTFVIPGDKKWPYILNARSFSCMLIKNDLPFRWEGRYNEDVDLYLKAVKEGYSTVLFYSFLSHKARTQTMGGGNTAEFYSNFGTLPKSLMLQDNHPDVTIVHWKFQRWHHLLEIDQFTNNAKKLAIDTVKTLNKEPILSLESDKHIIDMIMNTNFEGFDNWELFDYIERKKREDVVSVLKYHKYSRNNALMVKVLTQPRLLYTIEPNDNTEDGRIVKDILSLADDSGIIKYAFDETMFDYIQDNEKRIAILFEIKRNRPLSIRPEDYVVPEFKMSEFSLNEYEHKNSIDSKKYIEDKYLNGKDVNVEDYVYKKYEPEVDDDFECRLTSSFDKVEKIEQHTTFICGTENFNNKTFFNNEIGKLVKDTKAIINMVNYDIDLMVAVYALRHNIQSRDVVPDKTMYGDKAYQKVFEQVIGVINDCVIFVNDKLDKNMEQLVKMLKESGVPYSIVIENKPKTLF